LRSDKDRQNAAEARLLQVLFAAQKHDTNATASNNFRNRMQS
jgi:hypothetical protein